MSNIYNLFQSKLISIDLNLSISKQMLYWAIFKQLLQQCLIIGAAVKCIDEYNVSTYKMYRRIYRAWRNRRPNLLKLPNDVSGRRGNTEYTRLHLLHSYFGRDILEGSTQELPEINQFVD